MDRIELINNIISHKKFTNYLEIGVFYGKCFLQVKCRRKIAVDPDFRIAWDIRKDNIIKRVNRLLFQKFELYFKQTSDEFFELNSSLLKKYPPQLVFIDGLHTYEQTLRDVNNALKFLDNDGIIVLHDCNPENEIQALQANSYEDVRNMQIEGWDGVWNGDVWKTIAHLRSEREDLDVCVINTDCGLGIVRKGINKTPLKLSVDEIRRSDYKTLEKNKKEILNLVEVKDFVL